MAVMTDEDKSLAAWAALRERMIGAQSGDVGVTDVQIELYSYPLEGTVVETTSVTLVLTDPPPDADTWPYEDLHELKTRTYKESARLEILPSVVVTVAARPDYDDDLYGPEEDEE